MYHRGAISGLDEIGWCHGGVRHRAPNGANNQFELDTAIHAIKCCNGTL